MRVSSFFVVLALTVVGARTARAAEMFSAVARSKSAVIARSAPIASGHDDRDITTLADVDGEAVVRAAIKIGLSQGILDAARRKDAELSRNPNDGFGDKIARSLGIQILVSARDEAVLSAMRDLFPNNNETDRGAVRNLLCLCMDGKLTADNWRAAQTRDALVRRLRASDPDLANAAELADFISRTVDHYHQR